MTFSPVCADVSAKKKRTLAGIPSSIVEALYTDGHTANLCIEINAYFSKDAEMSNRAT